MPEPPVWAGAAPSQPGMALRGRREPQPGPLGRLMFSSGPAAVPTPGGCARWSRSQGTELSPRAGRLSSVCDAGSVPTEPGGGPPGPACLSFLTGLWRVWSLEIPVSLASGLRGRTEARPSALLAEARALPVHLLGMFCETGLYSVGAFLGLPPKHSLPGGRGNQFVNNSQKKRGQGG